MCLFVCFYLFACLVVVVVVVAAGVVALVVVVALAAVVLYCYPSCSCFFCSCPVSLSFLLLRLL